MERVTPIQIDKDAGTAMDEDIPDFPSDLLVEILLRLAPSARRRCRLVSGLWRELVDQRTTEMQSRPKTLVINRDFAHIADVSKLGCGRLWSRTPGEHRYGRSEMVGTCNGLLCLCDNTKPGGAIALANPVTGEMLAIPPLPCDGLFTDRSENWHEAYSFGYHPTTGRYSIVHVPCIFDRLWEFDKIQVFTLGEKTWRDATAPSDMRCFLGAGLVSVDGFTYLFTEGRSDKVMSFNQEDERVRFVNKPLPKPAQLANCRLTEVRGRLGIAITHDMSTLQNIEVWGLESVKGGQKWSQWYNVQIEKPQRHTAGRWRQHLAFPYFVHGDFVLTIGFKCDRHFHNYSYLLCKHRPSAARRSREGVVSVGATNFGELVGNISEDTFDRTFSYVETIEPLSLYTLW